MFLHVPGEDDNQHPVKLSEALAFMKKLNEENVPSAVFNNACPYSNRTQTNTNLLGISINESGNSETKKEFKRLLGIKTFPYVEHNNETFGSEKAIEQFGIGKTGSLYTDETKQFIQKLMGPTTDSSIWKAREDTFQNLYKIRHKLETDDPTKLAKFDKIVENNWEKTNVPTNTEKLNKFQQIDQQLFERAAATQDANIGYNKIQEEVIRENFPSSNVPNVPNVPRKTMDVVSDEIVNTSNEITQPNETQLANHLLENERKYINELQQSWNKEVNPTHTNIGNDETPNEIMQNVNVHHWDTYTKSLEEYGQKLHEACDGESPPPACNELLPKFEKAQREVELNTAEISRQQALNEAHNAEYEQQKELNPTVEYKPYSASGDTKNPDFQAYTHAIDENLHPGPARAEGTEEGPGNRMKGTPPITEPEKKGGKRATKKRRRRCTKSKKRKQNRLTLKIRKVSGKRILI